MVWHNILHTRHPFARCLYMSESTELSLAPPDLRRGECYRCYSTNCPSSRCRKLKLRRWPRLATRTRVRFWPSSWSSWGSRRPARTPSAPKWPPCRRRPNSWTPKWRWLVPWPAAPRWDAPNIKRPQTQRAPFLLELNTALFNDNGINRIHVTSWLH